MAIFGLDVDDFIAVVAVTVAVASIVITYSRTRKSEQIKIAREIVDNINIADRNWYEFKRKNTYPSGGSIEDKRKWIEDALYILDHLLVGVRYFTYLVNQKEIDNKSVLNYYKVFVLPELGDMDEAFQFIEEKTKSDTTLATALASDLPSRVADILPKVANIRRELSHYTEVWSLAGSLFWKWKLFKLRVRYIKTAL